MRATNILVLLAVLIATSSVLADRGSVPFDTTVEIYEPHQRALIAWNGTEQIMIMSTDLRASKNTKVLEILPLPSRPDVTEADVEIFRKVTNLINKKLAEQPKTREEEEGRVQPDFAGTLIFYKQIGVHEISLTHANDKNRFVEWANSYLRSLGVESPSIPEALTEVIQQYIEDGYSWFAFDVVSLGPELTTSDAVQYRFKTDALYYPLRITRTETGYTRIDLQVITSLRLKQFPALHPDRVALLHEPVELNTFELREISPEIDELLNNPASCILRLWQIQGTLSGFRQDLIAK
ncbi:MAG: DUF2330 domain-containing protein [bacterium]